MVIEFEVDEIGLLFCYVMVQVICVVCIDGQKLVVFVLVQEQWVIFELFVDGGWIYGDDILF